MVLSLALSEDRTFLFVGIEADNFRIGWKIRRNWQWLCTLSAHPISAYCRIGLLQLSRCNCEFGNFAGV